MVLMTLGTEGRYRNSHGQTGTDVAKEAGDDLADDNRFLYRPFRKAALSLKILKKQFIFTLYQHGRTLYDPGRYPAGLAVTVIPVGSMDKPGH